MNKDTIIFHVPIGETAGLGILQIDVKKNFDNVIVIPADTWENKICLHKKLILLMYLK